MGKNNTFEEIWDALSKSKKVLISLHPKPDGDSLGSCVAMKYVLEKMGKKVTLISKDDISENLLSFSFIKEVDFGTGLDDLDLEDFDTIIFVDHGHLGGHPENIVNKNFPKSMNVINIDHHETNDFFGKLNYVNPGMISCSIILKELFEKKGINFDGELCRRLLLGICTDSGFFINGSPGQAMNVAAFLVEKGGINFTKEFYNPINQQSVKFKKMLGELFSNINLKKMDGKNIYYSSISKEKLKELGINSSEVRSGINFLKDLEDTDLIFTLSELGSGEIKGSFRSFTIDTSLFAKEMDGGGHKGASAFYIKGMSIEQAIDEVFRVIKKVGFHEK